MAPILCLVVYLLATGGGGGGGRGGRGRGRGGRTAKPGRGGRGGTRNNGRDADAGGGGGRGLGRNRYSRDGTKKRPSSSDDDSRQEELSPLPPLTVPNGLRPSYYTCRHNYENILIDEIQRSARISGGDVATSSPYPGLVRVEDDSGILTSMYDPVYALQSIPQCAVVSAESIKGIAREVLAALLGTDGDDNGTIDEQSEAQRQKLRIAERGSLTIHPLVPGMCKGQSNPVMQHRSEKISEELSKMLKKMYPAARKAAMDDDGNRIQPKGDQWALQMMLQSPNIAVASLAQCQHVGPGNNAFWPNINYPLGLAKVDIVERMPSSAYRKLMEGIECMGIRPASTSTVVDLGACPGGWTSVMRKYFRCRVIAVDRSEVDPALMEDPMVEFVKGDAFAFEPPEDMGYEDNNDSWMISDVIAYPERTTEMLNDWCKNKWASNMIVTMKFQGEEPDLDELDRAMDIVKGHGYRCRVKHFFNNKNEVTFMVSNVSDGDGEREGASLEVGDVGSQMFRSI